MSVVNDTTKTGARPPVPVAPIVATILIIAGWLGFILIYALYWSKGFDLFQNIIVTFVTLMIAALIIGAMWVAFGSRYWTDEWVK